MLCSVHYELFYYATASIHIIIIIHNYKVLCAIMSLDGTVPHFKQSSVINIADLHVFYTFILVHILNIHVHVCYR